MGDSSNPFIQCENEWNFKAGYADRMQNLLIKGYQSDLTIVVGEKEFKVHKLFLQAGSPVLDKWIEQCSTKLDLENFSRDPETFEMFLKYLYTGDSGVQMDRAHRLLQMATVFEVSELRDQCAKILKGGITKDNVIQLFNEAMLFAHKGLMKSTLEFICWNAQEVMVLDSFNDLRLDGLVKILQQDSLRVKKEIDVFNAVYDWGEAQLSKRDLDIDTENLKKVLATPLKYIRFPLMDPKDFSRVVAPTHLLDSDETISLLTSFLLPLDERGDIHGTLTRAYVMEKDVVVYRAGCSSGQVGRSGTNDITTETLQFCSSMDGKVTGIALSEACFDTRCQGRAVGNNDYSGLTANVVIVQKANDGDTCGSCDQTLGSFYDLHLTRYDNTLVSTEYGYLTVSLPTSVEFPKRSWITIELSLQGGMYCGYTGNRIRKFQNASPYKDVFIDDSNPAIKFTFRSGSNGCGVANEIGLIHHFTTVLQC